MYDQQQKAYDEARATENTSDNAQLEAFKKAKELEYATKIAEAQKQ
jgi:hypothetical protein